MGTPSENGSYGALAVPRVAVLGGPAAAVLARELSSSGQMGIQLLESPDDLVRVVDAGGAEVALVLTDWGSGWPVTEGERLAARVGGRVPLVIVASAADDAEILRQRIGGPTVDIVTAALLTAATLADVIRAAVARSRSAAEAAAPP